MATNKKLTDKEIADNLSTHAYYYSFRTIQAKAALISYEDKREINESLDAAIVFIKAARARIHDIAYKGGDLTVHTASSIRSTLDRIGDELFQMQKDVNKDSETYDIDLSKYPIV